jgi:hypothetical protein
MKIISLMALLCFIFGIQSCGKNEENSTAKKISQSEIDRVIAQAGGSHKVGQCLLKTILMLAKNYVSNRYEELYTDKHGDNEKVLEKFCPKGSQVAAIISYSESKEYNIGNYVWGCYGSCEFAKEPKGGYSFFD